MGKPLAHVPDTIDWVDQCLHVHAQQVVVVDVDHLDQTSPGHGSANSK